MSEQAKTITRAEVILWLAAAKAYQQEGSGYELSRLH